MSGSTPQVQIITDASAKQATRPLYEQAFADPEAFVDYYYREKCADNKMVVLEEDGKILSMLHLNPYTVSVCGVRTAVYYVVAVATDREHRRKGYMARVLQAAFDEMKREGVPFCFLLPVKEAIYTPFGFETICGFITYENPLSSISYEQVQKDFDVYCVRDELYRKRRKEEDALATLGSGEVLPERPVIMARVTDEAAMEALLCADCPGSETRDAGALCALLRTKRCYFREEV